jgi:hypothetical protein
MGNPFPAKVLAVDREKGSLAFAGQWGGEPAYKIIRGCQYFLEDKPQYLDSPGEFWFDKKDTRFENHASRTLRVGVQRTFS